jgi:RNA polymerase sigma factor (sigma-70 family)
MRASDHGRFVTLLDAHKGILYKVVNVYCRAPDDRGDLLQEMLVQLWRSFDGFDERQRFSTWMYRLVMNVAISFYRKESRRKRDLVPLEEFGLDVADADHLLDGADDLRRLQEKLRSLAELDRALMLLYLDGHAHGEIAELMGLTATNVSTRIGRIKQKLQQDWEA